MSTVRLAIVYYSTYGTNHQMAEVAAEAARAAGARRRSEAAEHVEHGTTTEAA